MIIIANVFPIIKTVKNFVRTLSKKGRFGARFESEHVNASQILAKSPWEHFDHVFSSFSGMLIWNMSPLVFSEMLGVLVNRLTADGKYPVQDIENLQLPIQMQLSENQKLCLKFLFHFWNLHQILNILKKRIIVTASVFPKFQAMKILIRPLPKKLSFITPFDTQHVKASQILWKSRWERFYHVFPSFLGKLILKMSPLLLGEILRVFVNTLTSDGKYPVLDCENSPLPIQMQLSGKRKTLSQKKGSLS